MVAIFPLVGFLAHVLLKRAEARAITRKAGSRIRPLDGQVTDVTPLRARMQTVKSEMTAVRHERDSQAGTRRAMIAQARRQLHRLGFFRHSAEVGDSRPEAH
jgi:hypothetical protein